MTDDIILRATYDQFADVLGLPGRACTHFQIHEANPCHEPMPITAGMPLMKRALEKGELPNTVSIFQHKYEFLFKCVLSSLVPKVGDCGTVQNYCIDLMARMHTKGNEPIDVVDFLWNEIRLASTKKSRSFPRGPFIQALIDARAPSSVHKTTKHKMWTPRDEDKGKTPKRTSRKTKKNSISKPASRLARFIGRTQKDIFKACTFRTTEVVNMELHHYKKFRSYKDRLHAKGSDVSEDEHPPYNLSTSRFWFPRRCGVS